MDEPWDIIVLEEYCPYKDPQRFCWYEEYSESKPCTRNHCPISKEKSDGKDTIERGNLFGYGFRNLQG